MIDLYFWPTPNARKIRIMLEECNLPYKLVSINLEVGEQHSPRFVEISPNHKIPAMVDHQGPDGTEIALFESGAILMYLAQKTGRFLCQHDPDHHKTIDWLTFQVGELGPALGHTLWSRQQTGEGAAELNRQYETEVRRLLEAMDRHLAGRRFFAGDYSIADMAIFPWILWPYCKEPMLDGLRNLKRWRLRVYRRPAVRRGMKLPKRQRLRLCFYLAKGLW